MVFLRIAGLLFLAVFGFAMGQTAPSGLNPLGKFIALSTFATIPALYLLPTFEAWLKNHPNLTSIALVNVFLGWSLIGWIVALVWALKQPEKVIAVPDKGYAAAPASVAPSVMADIRPTKDCPFCGEVILEKAVKCKHCGSDLTIAAA